MGRLKKSSRKMKIKMIVWMTNRPLRGKRMWVSTASRLMNNRWSLTKIKEIHSSRDSLKSNKSR